MSVRDEKEIGLAIVGCGTIGRIRAKFARDYPGVGWLGLCDIKENIGSQLANDVDADFFTTNMEELIKRPEVTATMIITDENHHMEPTLLAVEQGHDLFIEKPLATVAQESFKILKAIEANGIDACVGYTNRFRRRFLAIKGKLESGQIGELRVPALQFCHSRLLRLLGERVIFKFSCILFTPNGACFFRAKPSQTIFGWFGLKPNHPHQTKKTSISHSF